MNSAKLFFMFLNANKMLNQKCSRELFTLNFFHLKVLCYICHVILWQIISDCNIEWLVRWLLFRQKYASINYFEKPVCFGRQTLWLKQKSALIAWCSLSGGTRFGQTNWISAPVQTKTQLMSQCCKTTHWETTLKGLEVLWIRSGTSQRIWTRIPSRSA